MAYDAHDPSVNAEPHLSNQTPKPDPAVDRAERSLESERTANDPEEERAKHSVFDEPTTRPNRTSVLIERDWSCRNCGYNLRGLMTGHRCPECGKVELYEPPREGELTYMDWLAEHRALPSLGKTWLVAMLIPLAGIPLAVACALFTVEYAGLAYFAAFGPAASEVLKVAIVAMLIERHSTLIRSPRQILCMTIGTALLFSVVQNVIDLSIYFKSPSLELVLYRWVICVLLHVACTAIATQGLIAVWRRTRHERRQFSITGAFPAVALAIGVHAVYNLCVFIRGDFGYGF